jgi:hypothetical protein
MLLVSYWVLILLLDVPMLWGWGGLRISEDAEEGLDVFQHNLAPVEHVIVLQVIGRPYEYEAA